MYQKHNGKGSHSKSSRLKHNSKHSVRFLLLIITTTIGVSYTLDSILKNPQTMNVQKAMNYELSRHTLFWNCFVGLLLICNGLCLSMYLLLLVYNHILLSLRGESTLNSPKIVVTSLIFLQLIFLVTYGHILDFRLFVSYIFD
jgi:hypothetical protein